MPSEYCYAECNYAECCYALCRHVEYLGTNYHYFHATGFFNEADILETSSIPVYLVHVQSIYTQSSGGKPA